MKLIKLTILIFGFLFFGCNQSEDKTTTVTIEKNEINTKINKKIFHNLLKKLFKWVDSKESIDVFPVKTDSMDSVIVGVEMDLHKKNLVKLRETNLFTNEFIENYNSIVLMIDKGLNNGKYEKWLVGEYPTFAFANGFVPWCLLQGDCLEVPFEIEIIKIDSKKGELKLKREGDSSWADFKIRVAKENNTWKIAYLEGFDFKNSTKRDGEQ